ncbi:type II toxin-antitoxin system YoeB family toxin [Flavobacterium sp.]|uniref:type II toxin-antitoxin system YoeB family toxin n=1 Tax=Flavobacterium sp. TaxID=239 RepID=UPI003B9D5BDB
MDKNRKQTYSKENFRTIACDQRKPFEGIGKPEPLKHQLSGKWSQRINNEHQ